MASMKTKEKRREYYEKNKKHICEVERLRREKNRPEGLKKLGRYVSEDELSTSWTQIPEHPGYFASREGEIVGKNGRILIGCVDRCGYKNVILRENGGNKQCLSHRLVASTFIDKPDGKNYINHKDGNKTNNKVDNLEWCTRSENTIHSYENGLQKTINSTLLIRGERLEYVRNNIGSKSDEEIAEHLNCCKETIRKIRNKIQKGEL